MNLLHDNETNGPQSGSGEPVWQSDDNGNTYFSLHCGKTYLGDEGPVLLHLMVVVMATGEELPNLPAESLGDAATHQGWQLPGTHRQVHVPERKGKKFNASTINVAINQSRSKIKEQKTT